MGLVLGLVFLWAAARKELGARLQTALRFFGSAFLTTALSGSVQLYPLLGGTPTAIYEGIGSSLVMLSFALCLIGVLWIPPARSKTVKFPMFLVDMVISVLGMTAILGIMVTLPIWHSTGANEARSTILIYVSIQSLMLMAVNILILRGADRASKRALSLLVLGLLLNLAMAIAAQLTMIGWPEGVSPFNIVAATFASMAMLWAGYSFRRDPITPEGSHLGPTWITAFNPIPPLAILGVAFLLLRASYSQGPPKPFLVWVVIAQITLLLVRLFLTLHENARLVREEIQLETSIQQARIEAIRRLAGGMAHWYNNLLTTVLGYAEIGATFHTTQPEIRKDFQQIMAAAERAARLTHQLLSYSGGQILIPTITDLAKLAQAFQSRLRSELPDHITLRVEIPSDPLPIRGDAKRIESSLRELTTNATKAMTAGGQLTLRLGTCSVKHEIENAPLPVKPGTYVRIQIIDTGTGIPAESLPFIFDPFFTGRPVQTAPGLGLAEVYSLMVAHGGGITTSSETEKGTTISLYFPLLS